MRRRSIVKLALLLALCADAAIAQSVAPPEPAQRNLQYHEHHRVDLDGQTVSTYRTAVKIAAQTALDAARQASMSVSRSAQQLQVLEAYTQKPDGRRIDVPHNSWQVRKDTGQPGQSPMFSDLDTTTLVFPELAVGDTVVLAYRITTREPMFPGKVSLAESFSPAVAFDDVEIVVDAPVAMALKTHVFDMTEVQSVAGGRRVTTLTWRNPTPMPITRHDWSVVDAGAVPGFLLSNFESWDDIAHSYVLRARPKAAVTPAVLALSNRVAAGQSAVPDKARVIAEWVATEIGYAGNCVGIGAVVPRDLDVVLEHHLGDCKDHATLLQALLAAQGIESAQVLVNAGSLYRLPDVPVASLVNHVLNYIPALDLFVDSTDPTASFGRLPFTLYAKPVLSDDPKVPRRIPVDPGGNVQTMKTTVVIDEDGSAHGEVDVQLSGLPALNARARFRRLDAQQRQGFVKEMYRAGRLEGDGTLQTDDPAPLTDTFHMAGTFSVAKAIGFPGTGGMAITPWFYNEAPILVWAQQAAVPAEDVDSVCSAGRSTEDYDITLPESMRVVAVPDGVAFNAPLLGYEASYTLTGRHLTVHRAIDDRTPPGICSAATTRDFRGAAQGVLKDVRQQVLYR